MEGEVLAEQTGVDTGTPSLRWEHLNPATGDGRETDSSGRAVKATHLDPAGVDVGESDPFASGATGDPSEGGMSQSAIDSMVASLMPGYGGQKCAVDGMLTGCGFALALQSGGAVALAPQQTSISVTYKGQQTIAIWRAYADGHQGYVPVTAGYIGAGIFVPHGPYGPPKITRREGRVSDTHFAELNGVVGKSEELLGRIPDFQMQDVTGEEKARFVEKIRVIVEKPHCKQFFEDLFAKLKESNPNHPPIAGDILSLLDVIDSQGGFVKLNPEKLKDANGYYSTVAGSSVLGTAQVLLNPKGGVELINILSVIHEAMHLAGGGSGYDDRGMAVALSEIRKDKGLTLTGIHALPEKATDVFANSGYWNKYFEQACNPEAEFNR